jgi:hypothetical protein
LLDRIAAAAVLAAQGAFLHVQLNSNAHRTETEANTQAQSALVSK